MSSKKKGFFSRRLKLGAGFFIMMFLIGLFGLGVSFETKITTTLALPEPEAGDVAGFFDAEAVNITFSIAPAVSVASANLQSSDQGGQVYHLSRVLVRSGTVPYSVFELPDNGPYLHNAKPEFLRLYWQYVRLTGQRDIFSLKKDITRYITAVSTNNLEGYGFNPHDLRDRQLMNILGALATANDTAEAAGYALVGEDDVPIADLRGQEEEAGYNISDTSISVFSAELDPTFQEFSDELSGNTSETDLVSASEVDDAEKSDFVISGFQNLEQEGFLDTLAANIAANYSVEPSQITILDYEVQSANLTQYLSENFINTIREAITEANENTQAQSIINIWGFKIKGAVVPVSGGLFDAIKNTVGKVYKLGKAVVSTPLKKVADAVSSTAKKVIPKKVTNVLSDVAGKISKGLNTGKAVVRAALSKVTDIPKSIGSTVGRYASYTKTRLVNLGKSVWGGVTKTVGGVVASGKKFISDSFNTVQKMIPSVKFNMTTLLLALGAGIVALIIILVLFNRLGAGAPRRVQPY